MKTLDKLLAYFLKKNILGGLWKFFINNVLNYPIQPKTMHGLTFLLDPKDKPDWAMHGYYEGEVLEVILQHLPQGGVFLDVGAHSERMANGVKIA